MTPRILILAAGSSSRMQGRDKLMEPIDGQALLTRIARVALATGCPVTVALPPDRPARVAALHGLSLSVNYVPNPKDGMASSLRAGLASLPAAAPVLLLLADLPDLTPDDLRLFLQTWAQTPDLILRGTGADGTPGHPVGFPPWARADLMQLSGDQGARDVLQRHKTRVRFCALPDHHATTDLDTPEAWAAWRAARNS